jgi:hypothetical protein
MFGFIKPDKDELKMREYRVFRAHYCGLCLGLSRLGGPAARLTLTYDSAFLYLLLRAFEPEPEFTAYRCPLHPLSRRAVVKPDDLCDYAAAVNVMLFYHNLRDKIKDKQGSGARTALAGLSRAYRRACRRYPEAAAIVSSRLKDLAALENEGCSSLDRAADPFAGLLGDLFAHRERDPALADELRALGYNLGKWIYTADAWADIDGDACKGSYNPLLRAYPAATPDAVKALATADIQFVLTCCLSEAGQAMGRLPVKANRSILENVVYLGLKSETERLFSGTGKEATRDDLR